MANSGSTREIDLFEVNQGFKWGYGYGKSGARIPLGYWTGKNMMPFSDGAWGPRYSYRKNNTTALPTSTKYPTDLYVYNFDDMVCIHNQKLYYKNASATEWTQATWDGGGSAPTLATFPYFKTEAIGKLILSQNYSSYDHTFFFSGGHWDYVADKDDGNLSYGGPVVEHANQLLVAGSDSKINYSLVGDLTDGWDQFVNVGPSLDGINNLIDHNGNLIVIKQQSIWAKIGLYNELESTNFDPVMMGCYTAPFAHNCVSADGRLYILTWQGVMVFNGESLSCISLPFDDMFKSDYDIENARLFYWHQMGWLFLCADTNFRDTLVFDTKTNQWMYWNNLNIVCAANSPSRPQFFTGHYNADGNPYVYEWSELLLPGDTNAVEDDDEVPQVFQTPYFDCGNPYTDKYLTNIGLYTSGVDTLEVYLKTAPGDNDPTSATYTYSSPGTEKLNCTPTTPFREISLKFIGSGKMYIKKIKISVEYRREP